MYSLPPEKIATHPLPDRDASKLLVYRDGDIHETIFRNIVDEIPADALIVRNVSRVIPARICFADRGELFLLSPEQGSYEEALAATGSCSWMCMVGGAKKIFGGADQTEQIFTVENTDVYAVIKRTPEKQSFKVDFLWNNSSLTFAEILNTIGSVPLPPYMNRSSEAEDTERYQTVFARAVGSVAAPTASLHFTSELFEQLSAKGCEIAEVLLHVGMGTFLPMKTEPENHIMHGEYFEVSHEALRALHSAAESSRPIVCIGTTAMRVVESLAWADRWYQVEQGNDQVVAQWVWKSDEPDPSHSAITSLKLLLESGNGVCGQTNIMCMPGYPVQLVTGLVTNFHQPDSTLLQLVSAFIGDDWHNVYNYALSHDFRFLSYGDGSLLWRKAIVDNH